MSPVEVDPTQVLMLMVVQEVEGPKLSHAPTMHHQ